MIEHIELRGLSRTRPEAVRRHLLFAEGEILDPERVLLSRLGLLQLGWFSRVETHVERGTERGKVLVVIEVVERNTLIVTDLVLGSTRPQPLYGGLWRSRSRTSWGRGWGSPAGSSTAGRPRAAAGTPTATRFAPGSTRPISGSRACAWWRGSRACSCGARSSPVRTWSARPSPATTAPRRAPATSAPAGRSCWGSGRARSSGSRRATGSSGCSPPASASPEGAGPSVHEGWSTLAALTGSYEVDTRDDFFYPTEGFHATGHITLASRLVGGDYEYSRYLIQTDTAYSLFRLPLRLQAAVGAVQGDAPFFDRFYAADYSYFAVGPALGRAMELNFSTDSRYDAFLSMAGLEYGSPLWNRKDTPFHRAYLAVGVRGVWSSATLGGGRTAFSRFPLSADVALRLDTIIGTFNLSVGYLLDIAL